MYIAEREIFTIGHSSHSREILLETLERHAIDTVADVRSVPYSRFNPQFNRDAIAQYLHTHGIEYQFLGQWLGARSDNPRHYDHAGRVQFERLAETARFKRGIASLARGAQSCRIALMCSEGSPEDCHRSLLIAEQIVNQYALAVKHILPDGSLETQDRLCNRIAGFDLQPSMLRDESMSDALQKQVRKIAYVDVDFAATAERREPTLTAIGAEH